MKGARCAGAGRWWRRLSIALAATGAALAGPSDWRPQSVSVTAGQTTTVDATLKTYHERIERGWPLTNDRHVMSPAYVYNQIKVPGPQGGGAYFVDAFNVLIDKRPSARRGTVTHWSARASIGGHHRLHRRSTFI